MSVRFRKDRNKWEASFMLRGQRQRLMFPTKRQAEEAVKKAKLKKLHIDEPEIVRLKIGEAFADYFHQESVGKSVSSKANDKWYFNLAHHFLTETRRLEFVDEISLQDLEALQKWLMPKQILGDTIKDGVEQQAVKAAWKAATVNRAFHTYDHFFNKMCAWEKLARNPAQYLKSMPEAPVKRSVLTQEMYGAILEHPGTREWFKDVLKFMWHLGVRGSSIARLTWDRVDLHGRAIELESRKGAQAAMKLIVLPMMDEVFALLVGIRNKWGVSTGPVFRYDDGRPVRADVISKAGTRALRACGFRDVDLYGVRHRLASELIDAGVDVEIVRQLLGHSSIKTTQNYTKATSHITLANALRLVRGSELPPNATKDFEDGRTSDEISS